MNKYIYRSFFLFNLIPWVLFWFFPVLYRSDDIIGTMLNMFFIEVVFLIFSVLLNILIIFFDRTNLPANKRIYLMIANGPVIFLAGFGQVSPVAFCFYELIDNQVIVFIVSGMVHALLFFLFLKIVIK